MRPCRDFIFVQNQNNPAMKKIFIFTAIIFFNALISCKKEESVTPTPTVSAKAVLLTAKPWKITAWEFNFNGVITDSYKSILACEKDDSYTFNADGKWVLNVNANKCNWAIDQTIYNGTWKLVENDSKLYLSEWSLRADNYVIEELSETTLKIALLSSGTINNGLTPYTSKATITYTH